MTEVIPNKQLTVSTFREPNASLPAVLCVEVGDHVAYFSGGPGQGRVFATSDGKKVHRRQAPERGLRGVRVIGDELWITGEFGTLARSNDRGASWTKIETPNGECLWDIVRDAKGVSWIGGTSGTILKSAKPGEPFKLVKHSLVHRDERADPRIELVPAGVMFALYNAYWNGKHFVKARGLEGPMSALALAPSGTIVIVGDKGAAFRSTDGGISYKPVKTGVTVDLEDVAVVAGGFVLVGDKGTIRRSEDDGVTWRPIGSGIKNHLWSIGSWGAGAFIAGHEGVILRLDSPGDTYWNGATDDFAPKPITAANITTLVPPTQAELDARFATLFPEAEAAHALLAAKLAAPKHAIDAHTKSILAAPNDVDEYKVLGDALQSAGDPRGELIALQTANETELAEKYLAKHRAALVGALAEIPEDFVKIEHRNGFMFHARVAYESDDVEIDFDEETDAEVTAWVTALLDEPGARFLQELTLGIVQHVDNSYANVIREIGRRARPTLKKLYLGDFDSEQTEISWSALGDATKLCGACPNLEYLTLRSGSMNLGKPGQLVFPRLKSLEIITGGLTRANLKAITGAHLPSLESLTIYLGTSRYGCDLQRKDLAPLLASTRFPRLGRLALRNSEIADELCGVLHTSPLVAQIKELDLSLGTLSDLGARTLATYSKGLAHLEQLDIGRSYVSSAVIAQIEKLLPSATILSAHQRGGEFDRRYVSVGE